MNISRHQLEADYVRRLLPSGRHWQRAADRALAEIDMSAATGWPILHLGRMGDGVRQSAIAQALEVEDASLVRQLNTLTEAGLVERKPDPADRRANVLALTAKGHAMYEQIEAIAAQIRSHVLAGISDAELATALSVLDRVTAALDRGDA